MKKLILVLCLFGCDRSADPVYTVRDDQQDLIIQFDSVGDELLSHIGYQSVVLDNGTIVLPDRELAKLLLTNANGDLLGVLGGEGRGPGEFQDISSVSGTQDSRVLVYDQMNKKIVEYDSTGVLIAEFLIPEGGPSGSLINVYGIDQSTFFMLFRSFDHLFNPESEQVSFMTLLNRDTNEFSEFRKIKSEPYAVIEGGGGAVRVPFAPADVLFFDRNTSELYSFYTGGNEIAQLTTSFDTSEVMLADLDSQKITSAEIDSLSKEYEREYWKAIKPVLPEYKATAEKVMAGPDGFFWFKLNDPGPSDQWLVTNRKGETQMIVGLPLNSMLTHISRDHLGVRLDDSNFALFSYPESLVNNE